MDNQIAHYSLLQMASETITEGREEELREQYQRRDEESEHG